MNLISSEAKVFSEELISSIKEVPTDVIVIIAPAFTALPVVSEIISNSCIKLGAQNINENEMGAFTGEISADMLLNLGVEYVIIGHSERRHIYKEKDELINKKVILALQKGLKPILCVGELLEEREAGKTNEVIKNQVINCLKNISDNDMTNVIIAYEPVWAIGTGEVATPEIAEEVHLLIRGIVAGLYNKEIADKLIIQYGGSVKPDNIEGLMSKENIDGALVGGASLKTDSFTKLVYFKH